MTYEELTALIKDNASTIADLLKDKLPTEKVYTYSDLRPGDICEVWEKDRACHGVRVYAGDGEFYLWGNYDGNTLRYTFIDFRLIARADGSPVKPRFGIKLWIATDRDGESMAYRSHPARYENSWWDPCPCRLCRLRELRQAGRLH